MKLALKSAERINADIVLATDPDADRIGVAVMNSLGNYQLLSGNQIGALLIDFLLKHTNLQTLKKPAIMKTIVSSELASKIAKEKGITVFTTLTGFKYTGEKINQFEKAKIENDSLRNYDFLFSYEESLGYLTGFHTRDKDAIVSALLICEMAAELKNKGKTLLDAIEELYIKYGYYYDRQDNYVLEGKEGLEVIDKFMKNLRRTNPFKNVDRIIDYSGNVKAEPGFGFLPKSNVLKYIYSNKSWVVIRPSGTEPKLKIYYSILGENKEDAIQMFEKIHAEISNYLYSVGINKTKEK